MEEDGMPALGEINMGNSVYSTPIVANNVLYIANDAPVRDRGRRRTVMPAKVAESKEAK